MNKDDPTTNQSGADETVQARADLAFLRAIVEEEGSLAPGFGPIYMAAGLLYGLQCLANYILLLDLFKAPELVWLFVGVAPTAILIFLMIPFRKSQREAPFGKGVAMRAVGAGFAGAGLANLLLAIIFGALAYRNNDWGIWFLFPVVVCALQGAIWFAASVVRRRGWMRLTALGWFAGAAALGAFIYSTTNYLLVLAIILLMCMALPGYLILRQEKATAR
jgi:hypothetical protein